MLGRTVYSKKTSRFEDSDAGHMSRPRAVSELPRRPAPRPAPRLRMTAAVGSDASGAHHRAPGIGVGRGTSPRSPLHEKKTVGAGPRVVELEAKLEKAHDQLAEMREQLAAAEKARKDARGAFVEARERFAAKKRVDAATSAPAEDEDDDVPAEQEKQAEAVTADVINDGDEERRSIVSMPAMVDVLEPAVPENEEAEVDQDGNKTTGDDDDGKKGNPEADQDQLRTKLVEKDKEVYELMARLMVKDMEVDELRVKLETKDTDVDALTAKLVAKDAEIATLRADNADLMMISEEASEAAKARGTEHALRESAAREARLAERVRESERAREALEAEAQRSRVQSEQWRKAAEEAAAVLGGADRSVAVGARRGVETGKDRRHRHSSAGSYGGAGERSDKQQGADDEAAPGGNRKSGATGVAMRVLSDLWKKKGQK